MKLAFSAAALFASSLGAIAADLPARTEAPAPLPPSLLPTFAAAGAADTSGFYAGGALAARRNSGKNSLSGVSYALPSVGSGNRDTDTPATNPRSSQTNILGALDGKSSGNTFGGSLFGGYNIQIDNFVYGVEADLTYSRDQSKARAGSLAVTGAYDNNETATGQNGDTLSATGTLGVTQKNRMNWDGSLRTRIGVVAAPSLLVFATGGIALGRMERRTGVNGSVRFLNDEGDLQATHSFASASQKDKIRLGWTVGAGVDYKITNAWTLRADYRYTSFGKSTGSANANATCSPGEVTIDARDYCALLPAGLAIASTRSTDTFHAVRVGLSYQFGGDILPTSIFTP